MKFIYEDNRNFRESKIIDSALRSTWTVSDIFKNDLDFTSCYKSESERFKWAPILVALAFGESTAFNGFGERIANAQDISTKSWLSMHLLDESKHTEGFSKFLNYLYPSYRGRQEAFFKSRDAIVFYGYTHRCDTLIEWLLCTQIAEVFGRQCYRALHASLREDFVADQFFKNIILDEARHVAYISELIQARQEVLGPTKWNELKPFVNQMIKLGRNMFEANRKGANYYALKSLDIDVTHFCNIAENDLREKYL